MTELALSWDWGAFLCGLIGGAIAAPLFLALLSRAAPDGGPDPDDHRR